MRSTPEHPDSLYEPEGAEWVALDAVPRCRMGKGPSWLMNTLILAGVSWFSILVLSPTFCRLNGKGQGSLTACKSNLKNIGTAFEMYSTDHAGRYPQSINALVPTYLKSLPECHAAQKVTYRASLGLSAPTNSERFEDFYYIECVGGHHGESGISGDYPAYNSALGLIERAPAPLPVVASPSPSPVSGPAQALKRSRP